MLQWMGGSRRKVTASRKSTHSRQKQYFEQRKRQQHTPGLGNNTEIRNKRTNHHEEPRSLDVLSLINLSTVAQQGSQPGTTSPNKYSVPIDPQYAPAVLRSSGKLDGPKILASSSEVASSNINIKLNEEKKDVQNDVSVLDLLSDDGPQINSEARSLPEAHVAFSVEGLGNVGIQTPVHSPRLHGRGFPSTPKALRRIKYSAHLTPIPDDIGLELNAMMNDIKMSKDDIPSESICNSKKRFDDLDNIQRTKFMVSCVSPDAYETQTEQYNDDEVNFHAYNKGRKEQQWNSTFDILDENFVNKEQYDAAWKNKSYYTEAYPSFPLKDIRSETYANAFGDPISPISRAVFKSQKRFDVSAPSAPCFKHLRSEKDKFPSFSWERPHANNERFNCDSMFNQHAWSFLATEDSQDSISLLSEESCSSTAVRQERSFDFESHSVKLKGSKTNHRYKFYTGSEDEGTVEKFSADEMMYTGFDEASLEKNLVGKGNCNCTPNPWSSRAGYNSSALNGILEPECISLSKEGYTSAKAAASSSLLHQTTAEIDGRSFDCNLMSEDDLFNMFPIPKVFSTTDTMKRRSISKMPNDNEFRFSFGTENNIPRQQSDAGVQLRKPGTHALETEGCSSYSYCAGEFQKEAQFLDLSTREKVGEVDEDEYTVEKPKDKHSAEKNSLSSVNSRTAVDADCKSSCNKCEETKQENEELSRGPTARDPADKFVKTPGAMENVPTQHVSCIDDNLDNCDGDTPVSSQVSNRESMKEKFEKGWNFVGKGGGSTDAPCQVMMEAYVLRLLRVQKVLSRAS